MTDREKALALAVLFISGITFANRVAGPPIESGPVAECCDTADNETDCIPDVDGNCV